MWFVTALIVLGIWKKQGRQYWKHAALAVLIHYAALAGSYGIMVLFERSPEAFGSAIFYFPIFALASTWALPLYVLNRGLDLRPKTSLRRMTEEAA